MTPEQALQYDPLAHAEQITGKRWSSDESDATSFLGLALAMDHSKKKEAVLKAGDDTSFSTSFPDLIRIAASEGFQVVHQEPTVKNNTLAIFWHPEGILLVAESYGGGKSVNTSKIYYNVKANDPELLWKAMSSGQIIDDVLVGDHDVREGFRHKLNKLREAGSFLPQWARSPFLWLLSYSETEDPKYDYDAINESRIAKLPANIQRAITP